MKLRFYLLFGFFTLLFFFYPGDNIYLKVFLDHPALFAQTSSNTNIVINPIPHLRYPSAPDLTAEGVYILDLPSFTPLYGRNEHEQLYPASLTKIVTALVAIDVYKPDDVVTVKRVVTDGQVMGLVLNERITAENLLYGLLVHSGNDAAFALADFYGYDRFIDLMNQKAASLSMKDTHFVNPAGLDATNQYTTPFDLAIASRALLSHSYLKKIVATKEITISDVDYKYFHRLSNVNQLLGEIQGIGGLKTGYTEEAGENLVSFYKKNDHQFIIILLKSQDRFQDTRNAVTWLDTSVEYTTIQ